VGHHETDDPLEDRVRRRLLRACDLAFGCPPAGFEPPLFRRPGRRRRCCGVGRRLGGFEVRDLLLGVGEFVAQVREDPPVVVAEEQECDAEDRERIVDRIDPFPEFRRLPDAAGGVGDPEAGRGPEKENNVRRAHDDHPPRANNHKIAGSRRL
jgi:hypothetical protein